MALYRDAVNPFGRLVSLSHVHDPATTSVYPGDPAFEIDTVATIAEDGYYLRFVRQGEHTGTHWGASVHFDPAGAAADELELDDLLLPAVRIDVRAECACNRDHAITAGDLRD